MIKGLIRPLIQSLGFDIVRYPQIPYKIVRPSEESAGPDIQVPPVRPLENMPSPVSILDRNIPLKDLIAEMPTLDGFQESKDYFQDYPPWSILGIRRLLGRSCTN